MIYVGLTDDPVRRWSEHGEPTDWRELEFSSERDARAWEATQLAKAGIRGGPGGEGWRFGYWYTITPSTME